MWSNPQFPANLVTFTEEILNGKLHFLCSVCTIFKAWSAICTSVVCEFISEQYRSSQPECSVRKVLLESPQSSQKNTCARVSFLIKLQVSGQSLFFNKVAGLRPVTLLKKRLWHRCFIVNFAEFIRTPFLTEHLR